jgi:hypothetical protein
MFKKQRAMSYAHEAQTHRPSFEEVPNVSK